MDDKLDIKDKPQVRVLIPKVTLLDVHIHKEDEDDKLLKDYHAQLKAYNSKFNLLMSQAVIPLRFSFLALLSARKVTIFSEDLLLLMAYVINHHSGDNLKICKVKP
jgi:hypothetical protein